MMTRVVAYLGKNHVYAQNSEFHIDEINFKIPSNKYQFVHCWNFIELGRLKKETAQKNQEISLVILDDEYGISYCPDPNNDESLCVDLIYSLKAIDKILPDTELLFYPACLNKKNRREWTELEKALLNDNLFLGTSENRYHEWLSNKKKSFVWTSNPLNALFNAQKTSENDCSPMVVLLYQNAPFYLFGRPKHHGDFSTNLISDYKPVKNFFDELNPDFIIFSERNNKQNLHSLKQLLRNYSNSDFNRGYYREALRQVRKTRKTNQDFQRLAQIFIEKDQEKKIAPKSMTPKEFYKMMGKAKFIRRKHDNQVMGFKVPKD